MSQRRASEVATAILKQNKNKSVTHAGQSKSPSPALHKDKFCSSGQDNGEDLSNSLNDCNIKADCKETSKNNLKDDNSKAVSKETSPNPRRDSSLAAIANIKALRSTKVETSDKFKCKLCSADFTIAFASVNEAKAAQQLHSLENLWFICGKCNANSFCALGSEIAVLSNQIENVTGLMGTNQVLLTDKIHALETAIGILNAETAALRKDMLLNNVTQSTSIKEKNIHTAVIKDIFANASQSCTDHIWQGAGKGGLKQNGIDVAKDVNSNNFLGTLRVDGVIENDSAMTYWERMEVDRNSIIKILRFLDAECVISNVRRVGKYVQAQSRRIIFEVSDDYIFRKILLAAKSLKAYSIPGIYINRQLFGKEAMEEHAVLKQRWHLINVDKMDRKDISYKHGQLFIKGELYIANNRMGGNAICAGRNSISNNDNNSNTGNHNVRASKDSVNDAHENNCNISQNDGLHILLNCNNNNNNNNSNNINSVKIMKNGSL